MQVLIIDDHPLFRQGLCALLDSIEPGIAVHEAASVEQALAWASGGEDGAPDLVLVDLGLPGCSGLQALERVKPHFESSAVVVVSGEDNPPLMRAALAMGAAGYVPKSTGFEVTLRALQIVLAHGTYVPPGLLHALGDEPAATGATAAGAPLMGAPGLPAWAPRPVADAVPAFTERQLSVLKGLMQGKPNKVIGRELGMAEGTVKAHLWAVYQLLGVSSRTQAVFRAHTLGLPVRAAAAGAASAGAGGAARAAA